MVFINPSDDDSQKKNTIEPKEEKTQIDTPDAIELNSINNNNVLVAPRVVNNTERDIFGNAIQKEEPGEELPTMPAMNNDGNALFAPEIQNEQEDIFGIPGLNSLINTPKVEAINKTKEIKQAEKEAQEAEQKKLAEEKEAERKKLEEEKNGPTELDKYMHVNPSNDSSSNVSNNNGGKYKLTLTRKKNFVGCLIGFIIYIDGQKVGKIKNGKTLELEVAAGKHTISIHKNNPVDIVIDKDTTADVVVYGANNFGITNINGRGSSGEENKAQLDNYLKKSKMNTNLTLISSIVLPIVSLVLLFTIQFYIQFYFHGITAGLAIVNLAGLKNLKGTKEHKSLLIKNIISIVVSVIAAFGIAFYVNFR